MAAYRAGAADGGDGAANGTGTFANQRAFEKYWKPILFPELVSPKKRPAAYTAGEPRFVRGEDIRWNAAYTQAVFPETLRPLRDSGTLLRDWEEAAAWIYLTAEWDPLLQSVTKELFFATVKK
jgi:hypothetical protein